MKRQTQDIGQCSCEMGRSHLNFLSTPGNTYTLEFSLHQACFATAVNNFFEVDDVFVAYEEEVVVEKMNYSVSNQYRYGFNSMEKDDEVKGAGNHYDLGLRNYDPRLGRMFIIDPRANEYPWQTTYAYHRNSPIMTIDFLGGGDADGIYIDEETGEFLGEDEFGADDGLVHYTSIENWDKYGNSPYANKSEFLKKDSGISLTIDVFNQMTTDFENQGEIVEILKLIKQG